MGCNAQATPPWEHLYYSRLLPQLVTTWRAAFGVPFAALIVQLAAYGSLDPLPPSRSADPLPLLRESQAAVLALPSTALALALDIGNQQNGSWPCGYNGGIHPRNKTEVGRRLALKLAEIEGVLPQGVVATGPVPSGFSANGAGVTFAVDAASAPGGALALTGTEDCLLVAHYPAGTPAAACCQSLTPPNVNADAGFPFEIRLADGVTYAIATAAVAQGAVVVAPRNASVTGPFTGVRYARQGFPLCALTNAQGLPMAPFVHEL